MDNALAPLKATAFDRLQVHGQSQLSIQLLDETLKVNFNAATRLTVTDGTSAPLFKVKPPIYSTAVLLVYSSCKTSQVSLGVSDKFVETVWEILLHMGLCLAQHKDRRLRASLATSTADAQ